MPDKPKPRVRILVGTNGYITLDVPSTTHAKGRRAFQLTTWPPEFIQDFRKGKSVNPAQANDSVEANASLLQQLFQDMGYDCPSIEALT